MRGKAISPALLLLAAAPAPAQDAPPDAIAVDGFPQATDRAELDWRIDAAGSVQLVRINCPRCRNPMRRRQEFTVDPMHYRRIAALIPAHMVEAALRSPCTLPHATSGWLSTVRLMFRSGNSESHTGYVRECSSPQLDALRERLAQASAIVLDLAEASDAKADREF